MQCSELAVQFPPGIFHTLHHKRYWICCNLAAVAIVYLFLPEANNKFFRLTPCSCLSSKWEPPKGRT